MKRRRSSWPTGTGASPTPAACSRGGPSFGHLLSSQAHPEVCLGPLLLFPCGAPTADELPRRETDRHRLLCSWAGQGSPVKKKQKSQGLKCKMYKNFRKEISELRKCIEIRRKIRKMQAQLLWNPCAYIYNFCYIHFLFFSIVFALFKIQRKCSFYCISSSSHDL